MLPVISQAPPNMAPSHSWAQRGGAPETSGECPRQPFFLFPCSRHAWWSCGVKVGGGWAGDTRERWVAAGARRLEAYHWACLRAKGNVTNAGGTNIQLYVSTHSQLLLGISGGLYILRVHLPLAGAGVAHPPRQQRLQLPPPSESGRVFCTGGNASPPAVQRRWPDPKALSRRLRLIAGLLTCSSMNVPSGNI